METVKTRELTFSVAVSPISQTDDALSGLASKDLPFKDLTLSEEGQPLARLQNCVFVLYQAEDGAETTRITFHCEPVVSGTGRLALKLNLKILSKDEADLATWTFDIAVAPGETVPVDLDHRAFSRAVVDAADHAILSIGV